MRQADADSAQRAIMATVVTAGEGGAGHGMQQALDYATTLEVPFVFEALSRQALAPRLDLAA